MESLQQFGSAVPQTLNLRTFEPPKPRLYPNLTPVREPLLGMCVYVYTHTHIYIYREREK